MSRWGRRIGPRGRVYMCIWGRCVPSMEVSAVYVSVRGRFAEPWFSAPGGGRLYEEMGVYLHPFCRIDPTAPRNVFKVYVSNRVPLLFMTER